MIVTIFEDINFPPVFLFTMSQPRVYDYAFPGLPGFEYNDIDELDNKEEEDDEHDMDTPVVFHSHTATGH